MEYTSGSYLMVAHKIWNCKCCDKSINIGEKHVSRVLCFGPELTRSHDGKSYQQKTYTRFHMDCALTLTDLNEKEKTILGIYLKNIAGTRKAEKSQASSFA